MVLKEIFKLKLTIHQHNVNIRLFSYVCILEIILSILTESRLHIFTEYNLHICNIL